MCSRVTMGSLKHIFAEGETEREGSGVKELVKQVLCSFFPLKKEHASALRRSWDDGNCRDGGSCGWTVFTTTSAPCLRTRGNSGLHLLRRLLPFGFGLGGRATCTPVYFGRSDRLGNKLVASAFVRGKLTIGIDLTFEDVENT